MRGSVCLDHLGEHDYRDREADGDDESADGWLEAFKTKLLVQRKNVSVGMTTLYEGNPIVPHAVHNQDGLFEEAVKTYGAALERLARAYEANPDAVRDLLQEIHIALWRSFAAFDGRCALRTWVYRVAHNVAASHVDRQVRARRREFVSLEMIENRADEQVDLAHQHALSRLYGLIQELKPLDRQVMLAYLEGMNAAETADITGLSARHVATKIHRIKETLSHRFREGDSGEQQFS